MTQEQKSSSAAGEVVTRFAPSPTGRLHIGGARTALYNWLHARRQGGRFLLRIEDTDRGRSRPEHEREIIEALHWLGIEWSGEAWRQSDRLERHRQALATLLDAGSAYRCVCPPERLMRLREEQMAAGLKPRYDGHCRDAGIGADDKRAHVVRLRIPQEGAVAIDDTLRGAVHVANAELDDMILARSDGSPTYQLSVVVDDIDAGVNHIIRGDDHLNNALRQAHLYQSLGAPPPRYTHLPLILDESRKRYSKRKPGANVLAYRARGYLPEALANYLLRLGWSLGDEEFFTMEQMAESFSLDGLNRSAAAFNPGKLDWLNRQHLRALPCERIGEAARDCHAFAAGWEPPEDLENGDDGAGEKKAAAAAAELSPQARSLDDGALADSLTQAIIEATRAKAESLIELLNLAAPLLAKSDAATAEESQLNAQSGSKEIVAQAFHELEATKDWDKESLAALVKSLCKERGIKMPQLAMPMRLALLGEISKLGLGDILVALGREEALARLRGFLSPESPDTSDDESAG